MRKNTEKAYLGFALMWKEDKFLLPVENHLQNKYGEFLTASQVFQPSFSRYYYEEMGQPLKKRFVITQKIINKQEIKNIKIETMNVEARYSIDGRRTVNIDPFYIDKDQLVVSTKKYRGNRIYIGDGVYLELELFYHHGSFQPFIWTYADYKEHINFFNGVRKYIKL